MRSLALLALAAGCFGQPVEDECRVRCGDGEACPEDYRCAADGFCHPSELAEPRVCTGGGDLTCEEAADCAVAEAVCRCGLCAVPDDGCVPSGLRYLGEAGACAAGAVAVAAAASHSCAVQSDGHAFCWGNNCHGELGNPDVPAGPSDCGDAEQSLSPVPVLRGGEPLAGVRTIHPGVTHTCALLDDGTALCWGEDANGQLGRDGDGEVALEPAPVVTSGGQALSGITALTSGWLHACALTGAGDAWCWGSNSNGQLGVADWTGGGDSRSVAEPVVSEEAFADIEAGLSHTCAVVAGGEARCWGRDDIHQLGDSATCDTVDQPAPVAVLRESDDMPLERATIISAGNKFTCAASHTPDALLCWGDNAGHKLGDDSCPDCPDGYAVCLARETELAPAAPVVRLAAGANSACALLEGGALWCWGASDNGQIGVPTSEDWLAATHVMDGVTDVSVGFDHACAIAGAGQVLCWGDNLDGELGTGDTGSSDVPVLLADMCP